MYCRICTENTTTRRRAVLRIGDFVSKSTHLSTRMGDKDRNHYIEILYLKVPTFRQGVAVQNERSDDDLVHHPTTTIAAWS